jgi:hypothetical protein
LAIRIQLLKDFLQYTVPELVFQLDSLGTDFCGSRRKNHGCA